MSRNEVLKAIPSSETQQEVEAVPPPSCALPFDQGIMTAANKLANRSDGELGANAEGRSEGEFAMWLTAV